MAFIEEAGWNRKESVASAMAYLINRQVVMTLLCSTMPAGHWLMRLMQFPDVYSIHHTMVCDKCAGHTETCVHRFYLRPGHIDLIPGRKGLVERVMEMLVDGFYQREIMGYSGGEGVGTQPVFPANLIAQVAKHRRVDLTDEVLATVQTIAVVIDPVQAASKTSGIGLCILLKTTQHQFYVSISFGIVSIQAVGLPDGYLIRNVLNQCFETEIVIVSCVKTLPRAQWCQILIRGRGHEHDRQDAFLRG